MHIFLYIMNPYSAISSILKAVGSNSMVVGRNQWTTLMNTNSFLTKAMNTNNLRRPGLDNVMSSTETGAKVPLYPLTLAEIQRMADDTDALRLVIEVLQREIFKNDFEVVPEFKYKCKNKECQKEYQTKPVDIGDDMITVSKGVDVKDESSNVQDEKMKCDVCGKTDFEQPTPQGRKTLVDVLKNYQNENRQTFKQVAMMFERDLDTFDNAYFLGLFDYEISKTTGKIQGRTLKEMITASPVEVEIIANQQGKIGIDDTGVEHYVCVLHREENIRRRPNDSSENSKCPRCDTQPIKAMLSVNNAKVGGMDGSVIYYGKDEVIFKAGKYKPNLLYGYSPIFSIWSKCESLKYMDEYVRKYFDFQRPPRSLLLIGTKSIQTASKAWDQLSQKAKEDPYGIHPLMVESDKGGRNLVQQVDLTGSLSELQFIDVRAEFKRAVGAIYGVLPLFEGDLPNGWGNDSLSMSVTNRAVTWGQEVLQEALFDPLCKMLEVTDWKIQLKASEETDLLREEQIQAARIANAQGMASMGFEPRLNSEGEFVFSSKPTQPDAIGAQGGLGIPKEDSGLKTEEMTEAQGEQLQARPSDQGGTLQGTPASGPGTSLSRK